MTDKTSPSQIRLRDPLSEVTRKERRLLLSVALLGIVLVKTGLVPSKVSALGIEFSQTNQQSILRVLAFVVIYFLCAFALYGLSDFLAWRFEFMLSVREGWRSRRESEKNMRMRDEEQDDTERFHRQFRLSSFVFFLSSPASALRAFFDFVLPIVIGAYAIVILFKH